ncbi:MAG: 50S ribosomal protein L4 [Vampirovibrionales bacterium]|jgi:large subunit ribosomal protein L4|nr:50S ribosomal protein L4 [Vampirovibrionales bacterium]
MSILLKSVTLEGQEQGTVEALEAVFGVELNRNALFLALRRERINAMRGTANTKTRSEVSGGGRKPWKQKGTGRARAGSIRSPLWRGGGVTFGPKPRSISISLNKKLVRLAHRSALTNALSKISVLKTTALPAPMTAAVVKGLAKLNIGSSDKVLIVISSYESNENLLLATRNIPYVSVRVESALSVHDILASSQILIASDALVKIQERLTA